MSDLDSLLEADAVNIQHAREVMRQLDPGVSEALDEVAAIFSLFTECVSEWKEKGDLEDEEELSEIAQEIGVETPELIGRIQSNDEHPSIVRARAIWARMRARWVRAVILLLCRRQFKWAATDILRMRLTAAVGYARQQAESVALLHLFAEDPGQADKWMRIKSDGDGRRFHQKNQSRLLDIMARLKLKGAYELGSGASLHVRLASAVRSLCVSGGDGTFVLQDQELDAEYPFSYHLEVLGFLSTQAKIFHALDGAFPEVSETFWPGRVGAFACRVEALWQRLEDAYPEKCAPLGVRRDEGH